MLNLLNQTEVYVINDNINSDTENLSLMMNVRGWNNFEVLESFNLKTRKYSANSASMSTKFDINKINFDKNSYFLQYQLMNKKNESIAENFVFPRYFKNINLKRNLYIQWKIINSKCQKSHMQIELEIKVDSPAYFVNIAINHPTLTKYRLSSNGFIQLEPLTSVKVNFRNPKCIEQITEKDFVVQTLNQYFQN